MKKICISKNFPSDRLAAAQFYYNKLDWAIHAVFGPEESALSPGKQPVSKGWPQWTAEQVTDKYLREQFGNGRARNVGCVVRPPHVVVDLDSKPDKGRLLATHKLREAEVLKSQGMSTARHLFQRCRFRRRCN